MNIVQDSEFEGTPTTRRFARSLSEAFPDERRQSIEPPRPSFTRLCNSGHRAAWLIPAVITVLVVIFGLFTKGA